MPKNNIYRLERFQTLLVFFLIGGIIGDQLLYLFTFNSKYIAHWIICLVVILASAFVSDKVTNGKSIKWLYSPLIILFLLIAYNGFNWVLILHEYSHLSYLLSYAMIGLIGVFGATYWQKHTQSTPLLKFIPVLIIGIVGKLYLSYIDVYFYLLLLFIFLKSISFYNNKSIIQAIVVILFIPIFFTIQINSNPLPVFQNQSKYTDRLIFSQKTDFHQVDITSWRGNFWFYYDDKVQFSTVDEWLYSEPMVHPLMELLSKQERILIIGGENGIVLKEVLKYDEVKEIDLLVTDKALFDLASKEPHFIKANLGSLISSKINVLTEKTFSFLALNKGRYDAIFIDTPDPINSEWNKFYSQEFYEKCHSVLKSEGLMITQASSPYLASKAFISIEKTIKSSGYQTLPLHNQVLSIGEWGWILAAKNKSSYSLKSDLAAIKSYSVPSKWLNSEAIQMLVSFGKPSIYLDSVEVNTVENGILIKYYKEGNYSFE